MAKLPHIWLARFVLVTNSNCRPTGGYFVWTGGMGARSPL